MHLYLVIALRKITVTSCKRQNYYVILLKNKNQYACRYKKCVSLFLERIDKTDFVTIQRNTLSDSV